MIADVFLETIVVKELRVATAVWTQQLGWEEMLSGRIDDELGGYLGIDRTVHSDFVVLRSPGSTRGFIRLIQGSRDDDSGTFFKPGLFNAELLCRDVDKLHQRLVRSPDFQILCDPTTYDLGSTGGACSRSFGTRGPGGAGVFFTTYLSVPPPRELPICEHLVGPMFNSACAVADAAAMEGFYETVLGMDRRLEGRIDSPAINRILGLPSDWAFHMVVYKGVADGLIEIDLHERELPHDPGSESSQLKPGNSFLSLTTSEFESVVERARAARVLRSELESLAFFPYDGRRAALLEGPSGENVELLEGSASGV
jgi:hypothetical protein